MNAVAPRVRFAPSPTGPLHVGSARTALLNWLFARTQGATLLLRIDDTDAQRTDVKWEADILDGLQRLGLDWNSGPLRQSERTALYLDRLGQLQAAGAVRERDGAIEFDGRVIARADGTPLYHLATAVDEIEDGITHVFRGRDHIANTELQVKLIEALGATPPQYVHAPLLLGADGKKLSKREHGVDSNGVDSTGGDATGGEATVTGLLGAGIPPLALCNALALSLAEFEGEEVAESLDDLARRFDLGRLHTADSHFDRDKLLWLSGQQIRRMPAAAFAVAVAPFLDDAQPSPLALAAAQTAGATLAECATVARDLAQPPPPDAEAAARLADDRAVEITQLAGRVLGNLPHGDLAAAQAAFAALKRELSDAGIPLGQGLPTVRAALSGRTHGPELPYVLALTPPERLRSLTG